MAVAIKSLPPSGLETSCPFAIASPHVPNEVGHLFAIRWSPSRTPIVGPQVVHHDPGTRVRREVSTYARPAAASPSHNATFPSNEIRQSISLSSSDKIQLVASL